MTDQGVTGLAGLQYRLLPGGSLRGKVQVPGDKSISHRALLLGAIAQGRTHITGYLDSADTRATATACRLLGSTVTPVGPGQVAVQGGAWQPPKQVLDMGNSGTAMRLLAGLLAGRGIAARLVGDASLTRRPMGRVIEPLRAMGARIESAEGGRPPLSVLSGPTLRGIDYTLPVASAQVKSAILLAGIHARGQTAITEPAVTRDHTERMLRSFGYPVRTQGARISLAGGGTLRGAAVEVPADISSAAFFLVGASIAPGSDLLLPGVGINPTRTGIIDILRTMGADITLCNERAFGAEPVADLRVRSAALRGVAVPPALVSIAIDEFPALAVAAACAGGETVITGAAELRVKESDRIATVVAALRALGVAVAEQPDGMRITGSEAGFTGGSVQSAGDHRLAMAFAMAALRASGEIVIDDCRNVDTSFPGFAQLAGQVGLQLHASGNPGAAGA